MPTELSVTMQKTIGLLDLVTLPCVIFSYGHFWKILLVKTPMDNLKQLQDRIRNKITKINNNARLLQNVINGVKRRRHISFSKKKVHILNICCEYILK
ncbi:hypothetical protein BDFB_012233 [Asbolus verrucosus]|uniref:Uncharacterized protein n=1 Tax=Asbolus verrucosus TaxID=1661398 RepID=A0A482W8Z0_ASBVE|nr:hypothetical protein BDFB_012233 [Asbolus verrucosus]